MKRWILPVLAALPLAFVVSADPAAAPAAPELTSLLREFLAGASKNDIAVHERFWADDLIYTRSAGVRVGKQDILEGLRAEPAPPADPPVTYAAEDIRIQQYGDTAVVAFRLVGRPDGGAAATQHYLNTGTFVRRNGEWRAVAWQATRVPDPAAGGSTTLESQRQSQSIVDPHHGCRRQRTHSFRQQRPVNGQNLRDVHD